jgi:hypothetical protein
MIVFHQCSTLLHILHNLGNIVPFLHYHVAFCDWLRGPHVDTQGGYFVYQLGISLLCLGALSSSIMQKYECGCKHGSCSPCTNLHKLLAFVRSIEHRARLCSESFPPYPYTSLHKPLTFVQSAKLEYTSTPSLPLHTCGVH